MKNIFLGVSAVLGMSFVFASNHDSNHVAGKKIVLAQSNTANLTPMQETVKVGACLGGGVVYWVNPDPNAPVGRRGLIVALSDAMNEKGDKFKLLEVNSLAPGISRSHFSGLNNTNLLYGASSLAAKAARVNNGNTSTCNGCTEWYLPSVQELTLLYHIVKIQQDTGVNLFKSCGGTSPLVSDKSKPYWSSSVRYGYALTAWCVNFADGNVDESMGTRGQSNSLSPSIDYNVRAVRAF